MKRTIRVRFYPLNSKILLTPLYFNRDMSVSYRGAALKVSHKKFIGSVAGSDGSEIAIEYRTLKQAKQFVSTTLKKFIFTGTEIRRRKYTTP